MTGVLIVWSLTVIVILWGGFVILMSKRSRRSSVRVHKLIRKDDAWTNGYKDMAYALLKELRGVSMQDEHYTVVDRQIAAKEHVLDVLIKYPEKIRNFKPANGLTSPRYLGGSPEEWRQYREGGMKFLRDLDEYQGLVLSRKASMLREDKRYTEAKRVIDEIRAQGLHVSDEHEEFDRQMRELGG